MQGCWAHEPQLRPAFAAISDSLQQTLGALEYGECPNALVHDMYPDLPLIADAPPPGEKC